MKFLHQTSKDGQLRFAWPKADDIDQVYLGNFFFGPITLEGCVEFTIPHLKEVQQEFESLSMPRQLRRRARSVTPACHVSYDSV